MGSVDKDSNKIKSHWVGYQIFYYIQIFYLDKKIWVLFFIVLLQQVKYQLSPMN